VANATSRHQRGGNDNARGHALHTAAPAPHPPLAHSLPCLTTTQHYHRHHSALAALPRRLSRGVLPSREAARRANSKVTIRYCDTLLTHTAALAALPRRLSRGVLPSQEAHPTTPRRSSLPARAAAAGDLTINQYGCNASASSKSCRFRESVRGDHNAHNERLCLRRCLWHHLPPLRR
jgi:hypothetical protein